MGVVRSTDVLKKFFTVSAKNENNMATTMENAMPDAMKTLFTRIPEGAAEDMVGLSALFVILFVVLSLPGLA